MPPANAARDQTLEDILSTIQRMITDGVDALENGQSRPAAAARDFVDRFGAGDEDVALVDGDEIGTPVLGYVDRFANAPAARSPLGGYAGQAHAPSHTAAPSHRASSAGLSSGPAPARGAVSAPPRDEGLLSDRAGASVGHAFDALSRTVSAQTPRSVEELVADILRPMLKSWLDQNLPGLVEDLVRQEIERIARSRR
ncbi:PopZ family protein [Segnochrobactrum spirostomi]|uniref:DUF2497 domain-containing protein n=1 Tax=Segnochrobactrum spirostomi TaxID=2608987 RepID=A0A6A7Y127_9HYPH|nr:DUF2497 domain-containing protein [Segnochrobactrum spirostomi]MQT11629.1 DUF2497 domain-containing protein [Segnochrobactrum spirostomi]